MTRIKSSPLEPLSGSISKRISKRIRDHCPLPLHFIIQSLGKEHGALLVQALILQTTAGGTGVFLEDSLGGTGSSFLDKTQLAHR
jgi:hypothetical protein